MVVAGRVITSPREKPLWTQIRPNDMLKTGAFPILIRDCNIWTFCKMQTMTSSVSAQITYQSKKKVIVNWGLSAIIIVSYQRLFRQRSGVSVAFYYQPGALTTAMIIPVFARNPLQLCFNTSILLHDRTMPYSILVMPCNQTCQK